MQAVHSTMAAAGGGAIVNLGSGSGTGGQPRFVAYAAAKEAIRGMSKSAALEWARDNIRVNVVCPFADSEGIKFWREIAPKDFEQALRSVPLRRVGRTREDIGAVVAFLIGDDGAYLDRSDDPRRRRYGRLPLNDVAANGYSATRMRMSAPFQRLSKRHSVRAGGPRPDPRMRAEPRGFDANARNGPCAGPNLVSNRLFLPCTFACCAPTASGGRCGVLDLRKLQTRSHPKPAISCMFGGVEGPIARNLVT